MKREANMAFHRHIRKCHTKVRLSLAHCNLHNSTKSGSLYTLHNVSHIVAHSLHLTLR